LEADDQFVAQVLHVAEEGGRWALQLDANLHSQRGGVLLIEFQWVTRKGKCLAPPVKHLTVRHCPACVCLLHKEMPFLPWSELSTPSTGSIHCKSSTPSLAHHPPHPSQQQHFKHSACKQ